MSEAVQIETTDLSGVLILTPSQFTDDRGQFSELWSRRTLAEHDLELDFVQENRSVSRLPGTVRGLHFQSPPYVQAKLVRCGQGSIFDVAVDVRKGSPTYGRWVGAVLSAENRRQLLVPIGFLHGFVTRAPMSEVVYLCSDHYHPEYDGTVRWDSPSLGIDWGLQGEAVLSERDAAAPDFAGFDSPFRYEVRP